MAPVCRMIDTTGLALAADGVHFAMPGLSELGKHFAGALLALPFVSPAFDADCGSLLLSAGGDANRARLTQR